MTRVLGTTLGAIGALLCCGAIVGVWVARPEWDRKFEAVRVQIDGSLEQAGERLLLVQERVEAVDALTADYRAELKEWAEVEGADPEHVGRRAELIAAQLGRANDAVTHAEAFLTRIRNAQRLSHPLKAKSDTGKLDSLLEDVAALHARLREAVDSFEAIRRRAVESGSEAELEAAIANAVDEVARVVELIESADERLQRLADRVEKAREDVNLLAAEIRVWSLRGAVGTTVFLTWMAIGQVALCVLSLRNCSAPTSTSPDQPEAER